MAFSVTLPPFKPVRIFSMQLKCGCITTRAVDIRGYHVTVECPHDIEREKRTRETLRQFARAQRGQATAHR